MPKLLDVDQTLLAELRAREDGTRFEVVREFFESEDSPITQIGVVQEGWDLCEVAAKLMQITVVEEIKECDRLVSAGALKFAVPFFKEEYKPPWRREHCLLISSIHDRVAVDVLYLPPMYLIKPRPGKFYSNR